jgi:hypothetical protein
MIVQFVPSTEDADRYVLQDAHLYMQEDLCSYMAFNVPVVRPIVGGILIPCLKNDRTPWISLLTIPNMP